MSVKHEQSGSLQRVLGTWDAVFLGLGSIIGSGVFISIGIAAGIAGPAVMLALLLAAMVALCNGLSSAQLAAAHPVSGGTYEYGYRELSPTLGFVAGWLFLVAKTASAATAALGASGYLLRLLAIEPGPWLVLGALIAVAIVTALVLSGMRRSSTGNLLIVGVTLAALLIFIAWGMPAAIEGRATNFSPVFTVNDGGEGEAWDRISSLLYAAALLFVAYTGYGRIATLGEEVREPRRTIPRAIFITVAVALALYGAVAFVAVGVLGAAGLSEAASQSAAPLEAAADVFAGATGRTIVAVGAVTAMLGVLLNLLLGLSRVVLAMARRRDLPTPFARVGERSIVRGTPWPAVLLIAIVIAALTLIGDVKTTWSFSAAAVLIYYAITNLAALRLPSEQRLYPRGITWLGLAGCLGLAAFVPLRMWIVIGGLLAASLLVRIALRGIFIRA